MFEKDATVYVKTNTICDTLISRENSFNLIIGDQVNFTVSYLILGEMSSITVENNSAFFVTKALEISAQLSISNKSHFVAGANEFLDLKNTVTISDSKLTGNTRVHKRIEVADNSEVYGAIEVASGAEILVSKCLLDDLYAINKGTATFRNSTVRHLINANLVTATGSNIKEVVNSGELIMEDHSLTNSITNNGTAVLSMVIRAEAVDNSGRMTITEGSKAGMIHNSGELTMSGGSTVSEVANDMDILISGSFITQRITNNGTVTVTGESYIEELTNHKNASFTDSAAIKTVMNNGEVITSGNSYIAAKQSSLRT